MAQPAKKKKTSAKKAANEKPGDTPATETLLADPLVLGKIMADVSQKIQPLLHDFFQKNELRLSGQNLDPMNIQPAYMEFLHHLMADPQKLAEMQVKFWQDWMTLWQESAKRFMGEETKPLYEPEKGDRRFAAPAWEHSAFFDFIKQSYLLTSRWAENVVRTTEGLDDQTRQKVDFYTRQFMNAMAPTNFVLTNPEVLQETVNTGGENLVRGFENLLEDLHRGHGELHIKTIDEDAFEVGRNLAVTPGKVVYQNDLMQLVQYEPSTPQVYRRPLLIVPPWINKFYILDLKPENSFIRWIVEQGYTVFTISWVNPDSHLAKKRFENYMDEGVLKALEVVSRITGEPDCNIAGYCLGGTLLATTLAYLADKGEADKIASATFLTTLVDFEFAGEMKLFIDDEQLAMMDRQMAERGLLNADHMRKTFSLLRANDLIWSFVVNNYLMGKEPFPFDLLYWNDDATNMPAAMHSFYLRKCYRDNLLPKPGGVTMHGDPIDMRKVETPAFFLSTKEDHIAPWKATYAATQLFSGPVKFTLAASGHVAGVVNPPAKKKYCYWESGDVPASNEKWLSGAQQHDGSWWPYWEQWLAGFAGDKVAARPAGSGEFPALEPAPGSYVRMKAG